MMWLTIWAAATAWLENGTGADRQLAVYEETKSLVQVAQYINEQYLADI